MPHLRLIAVLPIAWLAWGHVVVVSVERPVERPDQQSVERSVERPDERSAGQPVPIPALHVPHVVQVHDTVLCGGLPEGDAAFGELRSLGVRTLISVDGGQPDVATAKRFGMRYVHLPLGYDGVSRQRAQQLAKAVREFDGPILIHCHHGKHRAPAAASLACVAAGLISTAQALAVLEVAQTSPDYHGLFQSVRDAQPLDAAILDTLPFDYPERADVRPLAETMVAIGQRYHELQPFVELDCRPASGHDAGHAALLLREHFTELLRSSDSGQQTADYRQRLRDAHSAASELESAVRTSAASDAHRSLAKLTASCQACHQQFRD